MKISYLGPIGTYSYEACMQYIRNEKDAEAISYRTITDAILAVAEDRIEKAIVPIENSTSRQCF